MLNVLRYILRVWEGVSIPRTPSIKTPLNVIIFKVKEKCLEFKNSNLGFLFKPFYSYKNSKNQVNIINNPRVNTKNQSQA